MPILAFLFTGNFLFTHTHTHKYAGLQQNPPGLFVFYYAGHGIQEKGHRLYLVPGNAHVEHPDDLDHECLSLDKLMQTLRQELDEPVREKFGEARAIVFVVVLDACRVSSDSFSNAPVGAHFDGRCGPTVQQPFDGALACEPTLGLAPLKYTIIFSCSRATSASDGPPLGHSPFASALLDASHGIFAEGVSLHTAIAKVAISLPQAQAPVSIRLESIPAHFCISPSHGQMRDVSASSTLEGSGVPKRRREADAELHGLLREWKLEGEAEHLAEYGGVASLEELQEFGEEDVQELKLPVLQARLFRRMLQHLFATQKQQGVGTRQLVDVQVEANAFHPAPMLQGAVGARAQAVATMEAGVEDKCTGGSIQSIRPNSDSAVGQARLAADVEPHLYIAEAHKKEQQATSSAVEEQAPSPSVIFEGQLVLLAAAGNVGEFVKGMRAHIQDAGVQAAACKALLKMVNRRDCKVGSSEAALVSPVLAAIRAHPSVENVQIHACRALISFSVDDDIAIHIFNAGGVEQVVASMAVHLASATLQVESCWLLSNLAATNNPFKEHIAGVGGIERVIAAMAAHPTLPKVQTEACTTLMKLVVMKNVVVTADPAKQRSISDKIEESIFDKIKGLGGIERVLEAMKAHPAVTVLQEEACGVLVNISCDDAVSKAQIVGGGGIELLVLAMATHAASARMQQRGCLALRNLVTNNCANQSRVATAGGIKLVLSAMEAFLSVATAQIEACSLLNRLAHGNTANQDLIVGSGGIKLVVAAMAAHVGVVKVQWNGCVALCRFALDVKPNHITRAQTVEAGGIEAVLAAMRAHPDEQQVHQSSCE